MKKIKLLALVSLAVFWLLTLEEAKAATPIPRNPISLSVSNLPFFSANSVITFIVRLIIALGFILSFIVFLIGGVRWITSAGDPKALESAKGLLTSSIIGLILVVSAFAIIRLIEYFFGVGIISRPFQVPQI